MKKILFIVIDGLGDEPIPDFGGKTPLEVAKTPNLDFLAKEGICGLAEPKFSGAIPTSEEGHLSLFDYDPAVFKIRRGFFTAEGAGIELKEGDVALRGNFATVDEQMNVIDRRAGRIKKAGPLIEALEGIEIEDVKFLLKSATEYRLGIVMRALPNFEKISRGQGKGLSPNVSDGDPFYGKLEQSAQRIVPLDETKESAFTAKVLNQFLQKAHQVLSKHPLNRERKEEGQLLANYILVRGASALSKLPSFQEKYGLRAACIAGKFLYQQIGKILGMDLINVRGATGLTNTNLKGKIEGARKALGDYDFVFLHIKATDSLAEDGNFQGKKDFIEKIDESLKLLINLKNTLIVVTCDHSTCSLLRRHCKKACPVLIAGSQKDEVQSFSEKACQKGGLGKIMQIDLMSQILAFSKD